MIRRRSLGPQRTRAVREILLKPYTFSLISCWKDALQAEWVRDYWLEHRNEILREYAARREPGQPTEPLGWHFFEQRRGAA
jgi:hypothetical protein